MNRIRKNLGESERLVGMVQKLNHIVVVDDDPEIQGILRVSLARWGFQVTVCKDARTFWEVLEKKHVDLVVLDLNLPDEDGLMVCRNLRSRSMVPVIMLTSRAEEVERVIGLEIGADDYLTKPVPLRELVARIKSVLRRSKGQVVNNRPSELPETIRFEGWTLYTATRRLVAADGEQTILTHGEFRLLQVFLQNSNRPLTRDQLLDLTQRRAADPFDRSIDIQISRLRRTFRDDPKKPQLIQTVRGQGYLYPAKVPAGEPMLRARGEEFIPNIRGKRILVVDDDELFRLLLENLLAKLGCEVIPCSGGEEALDFLHREEFDLVFMDCHMPYMDGFATALSIRRLGEKIPGAEPLPIIAVSSRSRLEEYERCISAGMNDFLEKPVRLYHIKSILQRWLPTSGEELGKHPPESPVDNSFLHYLKMELGEDFNKMVQLFLESTPSRIERLEVALEKGAIDQLFTEAVRLLGSGLNIGAGSLSRYCQELSSKAARKDLNDLPELLEQIRSEGNRVIAFLKNWDQSRNH